MLKLKITSIINAIKPGVVSIYNTRVWKLENYLFLKLKITRVSKFKRKMKKTKLQPLTSRKWATKEQNKKEEKKTSFRASCTFQWIFHGNSTGKQSYNRRCRDERTGGNYSRATKKLGKFFFSTSKVYTKHYSSIVGIRFEGRLFGRSLFNLQTVDRHASTSPLQHSLHF